MHASLECATALLACGSWHGNGKAERMRWQPCGANSSCFGPVHIPVGGRSWQRTSNESTRHDESSRHAELHIDLERARELLAGRWIITVGDSTARFFFAALLSAVNGTEREDGLPLHTLPPADKCSFQTTGWVIAAKTARQAQCKHRWRGNCTGFSASAKASASGCALEVNIHGARHTYVWSTYFTDKDSIQSTLDAVASASTRPVPNRKAPIIFHAGAWWDLKNLNRVLPSMDQLDARIANGTAQLLNQLVKSVARAAQLPPVVVPLEVSACTEEEALRTLQV